jgi:hypothetical protein
VTCRAGLTGVFLMRSMQKYSTSYSKRYLTKSMNFYFACVSKFTS